MGLQQHRYGLTIGSTPSLNCIKQTHGIHGLYQGNIWQNHLQLIRLKMADEMPLHISHIRLSPFRTQLLKTPDLGLQLLGTALCKYPLPNLISLLNRFKRMEFRNCHQLYSCWQFTIQSMYYFLYHYLRF